jgi:hypothetical protein
MHVSDPTGLGYGCEGPPVGKVPSASKQEQTAHTTGIQPKRTEEARAASLSSRCQVSSVVTSSIVVCGGRSGPAEVGRAPLWSVQAVVPDRPLARLWAKAGGKESRVCFAFCWWPGRPLAGPSRCLRQAHDYLSCRCNFFLSLSRNITWDPSFLIPIFWL